MTDRSVKVTLQAEVAGYVAKMGQAAAATKGVATEVSKNVAANKQASQDLGRTAAVGGAALLALSGAVLMTEAKFDKAMSGVQAATHETTGNMRLLREAAVQAGADTAFSASEAAQGLTELAKAGVSTKDSLGGGLRGALDLAAAGQIGVGEAAETAASAMTQFGLAGAKVPHIADLLAAGAGKAQGSVGDMGAALKQSGLVANQFGLSIEDTVGSLAAFASAGLVGSDAGTSFRSMLLHLANPANETKLLMADLGISAYDAQGQFVGLAGLAGQLQEKLGGLAPVTRDAAMAQIFGTDAIRAANVLYTQGADGIADWTARVNDSGYAATTAAIQLDNLRGDVEKFTGSLETAFIGSGGAADEFARGAVQNATSVVNAYSALPQPVQEGALALTAIAGATLVAGGALLYLLPKIAETRAALIALGVTSTQTSAALAGVGKGVALVAIAAGANIAATEIGRLGAGSVEVDKLAASLERTAETGKLSGAALTLFDSGFGPFTNHADSSAEALNRFAMNAELALGSGLNQRLGRLQDMGATTAQFEEQVSQLDAALAQMVASGNGAQATAVFDQLMRTSGQSGDELEKLKLMFPEYAGAATVATEETRGFGGALRTDLAPAAEEAAAALESYQDALTDTAAIDAYTATAQLAESFKDLSKEIKTAGKVTNDEKIALGGFASEVRGASSAILEQTGSQEKANAAMRSGRKQFIDLAVQAGYTRVEARKLANTLLDIPARTDVTIRAPGMDAVMAAIIELRRQAGIPISVTVNTINRLRSIDAGVRQASGGYIAGPGSGTSDSIPAWLSNGEYVVRAAAVNRYGPALFHSLNAERFAEGGQPGRGAAATAAGVAAIAARTPGSDSVAEIEKAIRAVERLTQAYEDQRATKDMNAKERRRYFAEQEISANEERLSTRKGRAEERADTKQQAAEDRAELRAKAVEEAAAHAEMLSGNRAEWEFSHLNAEQQVFDLDRRIGAEEQFTDTWLTLSRQREQLAQSMLAEDRAAAAERERIAADAVTSAIRVRDEYARTVAASITGFGALGSGSLVGAASVPGQLMGADVGGRDIAQGISGGQIAATVAARLAEARGFVGDMRTLRAAELNDESLREIMAMSPDGGSAYARALAADTSVLGSINRSQSEIGALAGSFGLESSNWFNQSGITNALSAYRMQPSMQIRVQIGDREITDIVAVEVNGQTQGLANSLVYGRSG